MMLTKALKEVRELTIRKSKETTFKAAETISSRVMKQNHA
jgi:hypothetical protein